MGWRTNAVVEVGKRLLQLRPQNRRTRIVVALGQSSVRNCYAVPLTSSPINFSAPNCWMAAVFLRFATKMFVYFAGSSFASWQMRS
jgi:hypothetical protein